MKQLIFIFIFAFCQIRAQEPIFATIPGGDLYSFDLTNCTRRFIGSTGQGFGDIAFTTDGKLWGIIGGSLYHIDTTTANATLIGFTGVLAVSLVGISDSILLAEYGMKLYSINTNNANASYIDSIGYQAAGDLTWYDNDLYMVSPLIKIILNSTYDSILTVIPINIGLPTCEGAVTKTFTGDYNAVLGFNGADAIKVCQINGTYQILCPNINPGGTPGAASIRLPAQSPVPTSCSMTSIQGQIGIHKPTILPNPAEDYVSVICDSPSAIRYSIYDYSGCMKMKGSTKPNSKISLDNLINGFYILEFESNAVFFRQTFVVIK